MRERGESQASKWFHHKEAATPPPTGGEMAKRVLYGAWDATKKVGRVIESQSPRAWNERIIKVINEKIIPQLTPEQLAQVAKHKKFIEGTATVVGVGISTAELVVVSVAVQKALQWLRNRQRYKQALRRYALTQEAKRQFPTEWPYVPLPKPVPGVSADTLLKGHVQPPRRKNPVKSVEKILGALGIRFTMPGQETNGYKPWKPRKKSLKSLKKILDTLNINITIPTKQEPRVELSAFTRWAQALRREYNHKYANPAEAALLVGTLRVMLGRLSLLGQQRPDDRNNFRLLAHSLASGQKYRQEYALKQLKKSFQSAFVEMQQSVGSHATTERQARLQQARAGALFDRWSGIELLGLVDMFGVVEREKGILEAVQRGIRIPLIKDFHLVGAAANLRNISRSLRNGTYIYSSEPKAIDEELLEAKASKSIKPIPDAPVTQTSTVSLPSTNVWTDAQIRRLEKENERGHRVAKARRAQAKIDYEKLEQVRQQKRRESQLRAGIQKDVVTAFEGHRDSRVDWFTTLLDQARRSVGSDGRMRQIAVQLANMPSGNAVEQRLEQQRLVAYMLRRSLDALPKKNQDLRGFRVKEDVVQSMAAELVWNRKLAGVQYVLDALER